MTILSSISSAFGVPNPVTALVGAVQQAVAPNTPATPTTPAATPDATTTSSAASGSHHHHHGGAVAGAGNSPASTFVSTLNSALATLGASDTGTQAGSGATATLYA